MQRPKVAYLYCENKGWVSTSWDGVDVRLKADGSLHVPARGRSLPTLDIPANGWWKCGPPKSSRSGRPGCFRIDFNREYPGVGEKLVLDAGSTQCRDAWISALMGGGARTPSRRDNPAARKWSPPDDEPVSPASSDGGYGFDGGYDQQLEEILAEAITTAAEAKDIPGLLAGSKQARDFGTVQLAERASCMLSCLQSSVSHMVDGRRLTEYRLPYGNVISCDSCGCGISAGEKAFSSDQKLGDLDICGPCFKQERGAQQASSPSPAPPAAQLAAQTSTAAKVPQKVEDAAIALLIGASQNPSFIIGQKEMKLNPETDGIEFRSSRYQPRAMRGGNALPDILKDVTTVKRHFQQKGGLPIEVHSSFVGKEGSGSLTRRAFLNKLERLFAVPGKKLYILYYAGHGSGDGGKLCMEDGYVTFEDILHAWQERPIAARRSQYFVLIADSCHSGQLVEKLKKLPKAERDVLNMAVQAACAGDELSSGGVFTETFFGKQENPPKKFQWKAIFDEEVADLEAQAKSEGRVHDSSCSGYFSECCRLCRHIRRANGRYLNPRSKEDLQHPTFYSTWRANKIELGGAELRLFERQGKRDALAARVRQLTSEPGAPRAISEEWFGILAGWRMGGSHEAHLSTGEGMAGQGRRSHGEPQSSNLPAGSAVVIHGLTGAPQHNGKHGTVIRFDAGKGRYEVQPNDEGEGSMLLKPCNVGAPQHTTSKPHDDVSDDDMDSLDSWETDDSLVSLESDDSQASWESDDSLVSLESDDSLDGWATDDSLDGWGTDKEQRRAVEDEIMEAIDREDLQALRKLLELARQLDMTELVDFGSQIANVLEEENEEALRQERTIQEHSEAMLHQSERAKQKQTKRAQCLEKKQWVQKATSDFKAASASGDLKALRSIEAAATKRGETKLAKTCADRREHIKAQRAKQRAKAAKPRQTEYQGKGRPRTTDYKPDGSLNRGGGSSRGREQTEYQGKGRPRTTDYKPDGSLNRGGGSSCGREQTEYQGKGRPRTTDYKPDGSLNRGGGTGSGGGLDLMPSGKYCKNCSAGKGCRWAGQGRQGHL
jgi:hypothetical protein